MCTILYNITIGEIIQYYTVQYFKSSINKEVPGINFQRHTARQQVLKTNRNHFNFFLYITNNLLMLLLVLSLMMTCYLLTHADLHDGGALVSLLALALEVAGSVPANTVSAHSVHDAALVNICKHRRHSVDLSTYNLSAFYLSVLQTC